MARALRRRKGTWAEPTQHSALRPCGRTRRGEGWKGAGASLPRDGLRRLPRGAGVQDRRRQEACPSDEGQGGQGAPSAADGTCLQSARPVLVWEPGHVRSCAAALAGPDDIRRGVSSSESRVLERNPPRPEHRRASPPQITSPERQGASSAPFRICAWVLHAQSHPLPLKPPRPCAALESPDGREGPPARRPGQSAPYGAPGAAGPPAASRRKTGGAQNAPLPPPPQLINAYVAARVLASVAALAIGDRSSAGSLAMRVVTEEVGPRRSLRGC